jgi:ATP-dependent helicase HepA
LDRLKAGQIGSTKWFNLYRQLTEAYTEFQGSKSYGFVGPKINIIPHQFDVAQQILNMPLPRALLADEVGLGKTIEAGLVIHQLIASGRAQRILICTPASLVNQWLVEMKRKFNLDCTLVDDEFCAEQQGQNPFNQVQVALCNFDWLAHSKFLDQARETDWDMMVIDESHRVQVESKAYKTALQLSKISSGVLLLTATPEQLGVESHFARLHLLDPLRFPDLDQFLG